MTREATLQRIREALGDKVVDWFDKSEKRSYVEIRPEDVPDATRLVFRELGARFQIATGVDTPSAIEILYHWAFDKVNLLVTIRTKLDRDTPEIASLAGICKGTEWIEREMWELLGITFHDHPDMRHLLLTDEWPEGQYPLRRDFVQPGKEGGEG
ncbi:MAG: NADH-quinone oxidoreductase subunit C [Kiritimatiellae bacterium]|nr:NADH-quinone oxidoreductase subunit C [Kiritimatiellia bacterium]